MKTFSIPGVLGYAFVGFWFLMTISEARSADQNADSLRLIVENALAGENLPAEAQVRIDWRNSRLPEGFDPLRADVNAISFSPQSGRFVVRFEDAVGMAIVSGEAAAIVQIPAPSSGVAAGETISANALGWTDVPQARARSYIADPEDLVGKIARRPLAAGAPIRKNDVAAPHVIEKGDLITLVFESPGIRLTNQGVALARAAIGDVVNVRSLKGGQTIAGVALGEGYVRAGGRRPGRRAQGSRPAPTKGAIPNAVE